MVNKLVGYDCNSAYNTKHEEVRGFSFRFNKSDLRGSSLSTDLAGSQLSVHKTQ